MIPGEVVPAAEPVTVNAGRDVVQVRVVNTGDRPIQVGSHYHFAEANPALDFDRPAGWGTRLNIPAGTSARFEPGVAQDVTLVALAGHRVVAGLRGECAGAVDRTNTPSPSPGSAQD